MFYEKFNKCISNSNRNPLDDTIGCENVQTVGTKTRSTGTGIGLEALITLIEKDMPSYEISLEADEDPFSDVGEENTDMGMDDDGFGSDDGMSEGSDEDPFGDVGNDDGMGMDGGDDGDPFGDIADDGNADDPFGEDGGDDIFGGDDDNDKKSKPKEVKLDRKKSIEEEFDISTQIRYNFSKKFLDLDEQINTNIAIIDRTINFHPRLGDLMNRLKQDYVMIQSNIQLFSDVVVNKTYEEIFQKYVECHTHMMKIKQLFIDALDVEKK